MLHGIIDTVIVRRARSLAFVHRYHVLLKAHYFLFFAACGSIGPILNIILRGHGITNMEISIIHLVIPFLVFFTNPIIGLFADRTHRFRLAFNTTLGLATLLILGLFYFPDIKTYNIVGELRPTQTTDSSLVFCANEELAVKCALRSECGCVYQAKCVPSTRESIQMKTLNFNFSMNSTYGQKYLKDASGYSKQPSKCDVAYTVPVNNSIVQYGNHDSYENNFILATCDVTCSVDHLCAGPRQPNQRIILVIYALLAVIALNLLANATTVSTAIGFASVRRAALFGEQRVWGTIGFGTSAFIASRLYERYQTEYIYISMFIVASGLCMMVTMFIHIHSEQHRKSISKHNKELPAENSNDLSGEDDDKSKSNSSNIWALLSLFKETDVMVFLLTTFLWGTSFAVLDPYLLLYIDEVSPCQTHSIAGYISLITAGSEVVALFTAHGLLKSIGINIATILIFLAFTIRFFGYYFIDQPLYILSVETMHFFNFGVLYVLIAQEAFMLAPPRLAGTLQAIVYGISFGLGRGVGLFICLLIYARTKEHLFLTFAIFNLLGMIIYSVYYLFNRRKSSKATELNTNGRDLSKNGLITPNGNHDEELLLSSTKTNDDIKL